MTSAGLGWSALGVLLVAVPEQPLSTIRREARTAVEATARVVKRAMGLMLRRRG